MGGGGGDDFEAQQAATEAKKQKARDALNLMFGVAPTTSSTVDRSLFSHATPGQTVGSGDAVMPATEGTTSFDQAGYDSAVAANANQGAEAAANKTARDALYQKVRDDAFDAGKRRFDESKTKAARQNKFALFAQGLNGGSVDVDENALLSRTYGEGLLDLGNKADTTKNDMLGNDEQTRLGLLQSIDSGMDQGSALSSAMNQLKVNSERAANDAKGTTLGDLFGDAGLLYTKNNAARGRADAQAWWQQQYPNSPWAMRSSRGASSGVESPTEGRG